MLWKKALVIMMTAASVCCCLQGLPVSAAQTASEQSAETSEGEFEKIFVTQKIEMDAEELPEEIPDNEELFAGYAEGVFYSDLYKDEASEANLGETKLTNATEKKFYTTMKANIKKIAAGSVSSTVFSANQQFTWTAGQLGVSQITSYNVGDLVNRKFNATVDMGKIISYLLMDCPFDLYWYDKTEGMYISYYVSGNQNRVTVSDLQIHMSVAKEYQNGSEYMCNKTLAQSVQKTKTRAVSIVNAYKSFGTYDKLLAYKNIICDMVSYNDAAVDYNMDYGNPWQLIWVFDDDPSTNVVCEGYSKAFQYLCDLSGLPCYTICGEAGGPHMWNIVTFMGKNYLVDVTNCDSGTAGYPDKLFLAGTNVGSVSSGYVFSISGVGNVRFTYDDDQLGLFGSKILTLASSSFDPSTIVRPKLVYEETAKTVMYTGGLPLPAAAPKVLINGEETHSLDNAVKYKYRTAGSTDAFKTGLPKEPGVYEISTLLVEDGLRAPANSNVLTLTIENSYKIDYHVSWNTDNSSNPARYSESFPATLTDPTRPSHTFGGWYLNPDFSGQPITEITTATNKCDISIYPKWTFDTENGKISDVFSDISENAWYTDAVRFVYLNGIMEGNGDKFTPNGNMTRGMFVTTLYRLAGKPEITDRSACEQLKDVASNAWYTDAVCWAYSTGVTTGYTDTMTFGMNNPLTREQLAAFLYRYAEYTDLDVSQTDDLSGLLNADKIKDYAVDNVKWAVGAGVISGLEKTDENGETVYDLAPQGKATRAQMAVILMRFCENYNIEL